MRADVELAGRQAFAACEMARDFIHGFHVQVGAATEVLPGCTEAVGVGPQTFRGYYSRTLAWMESVSKLNNAGDVQAIAVAARALFEGQVDLVLLVRAPADHPPQKVFDWERSALLKHAKKVERFFAGKTIPPEYDLFPAFLQGAEVPMIEASRKQWPDGKHPPRWTGRNLEQDAKRADPLFPEAELAAFYELEYSPSCWGAHGSSMAGLRSPGPDLVAATCASQLWTVRRFALLNMRLVLESIGQYLKVTFDDFETATARRFSS